MNLRDLEYLVSVYQHKHFGKAADACFVSQPTLSGQLKKLQEELQIELIEKSNRRVVFTEAGEQIVRQAEEVLRQSKDLELMAQSLKDPLAGRLVMGAIPTVGPYFYPLILRAWRNAFPNVEFELHELKTEEIIQKLLNAEIDLGILALPLDVSQLTEKVIYEEAFCVAAPRNLDSENSDKIDSTWLDDKNLMLLSEGHCFRDQALQYCALGSQRKKTNFNATSLETLRSMVSLGEGVTLVPELTANQWLESRTSEDIKFLDFTGPTPVRQVGFIYRKGTRQEHLFTELAQVAGDEINQRIKERSSKSVIPVNP